MNGKTAKNAPMPTAQEELSETVAEETPVVATEPAPWNRSSELTELKTAIQKNRATLERLRVKYPMVWHIDFSIRDYTKWILELTTKPNPTIYDLTLVCLAVRAATDVAEFDWRTRPSSKEIDSQITGLIPAVQRGLKYIAGRRGLSQPDEAARLLYEEHVQTNLSILETLVSDELTRDQRADRAATLREGKAVST